jgi:hypothetical protein
MSLKNFDPAGMVSAGKIVAKLDPTGLQTITKTVGLLSGFVKTVSKSAIGVSMVAAATPDIMDFMSGLTEPFDQVKEAVTELGLEASVGFEEMATDIADSIYNLQPVAAQLGDWIGDTYDKVKEKDWSGLSGNVETGLTTAWDSIVDFFGDEELMADIGEGAAAIVNGISGFINNITQDDWDDVFNGIIVGMKTFFENIQWDQVLVGVISGVSNIGEAIWDALIAELLGNTRAFGGDDEYTPGGDVPWTPPGEGYQ